MKIVFDYLLANPIPGLILGVLLIGLIFFILKKLFKLALILGIIFLISSGAVFKLSHEEFTKKGKDLIKTVEDKVTSGVKKYMPKFDTSAADTVKKKPLKARKARRVTAKTERN